MRYYCSISNQYENLMNNPTVCVLGQYLPFPFIIKG